MSGKILLEVQDLRKDFGDHQVLKGITTKICQGEVVAIIGPSGCGKSTFLRSLNLLETPTGGSVIFEGNEITAPGTDVNKIRQKIGMVFQQFNLFANLSIQDNITLAPIKLGLMGKEEAERKAKELLGRVGLPDGRFLSRYVVWGTETENCHCAFPCHESRCNAF